MATLRPRFPLDRPLLVIDVVGMRPVDLNMAPKLRALGDRGSSGPLQTIVPALTSSVQATVLTGCLPREHGIVGNGWYFRELAQIWFWRQSHHLVEAPSIYDLGLAESSGFRCAKLFWWFNMYSSAAISLTPRPQYFANGLKVPGLYGRPSDLVSRIEAELGDFPLYKFWGPGAGIESTRWIVDASILVLERERPGLALVYLPHLDYDHQRFGPDEPRSREAVAEVDREAGRLIEKAEELGMDLLVMSEYGIEPVDSPVFINRSLRESGFLEVQKTRHGELLDAGASTAFAVADHQIAHVYVADAARISEVRRDLRALAGIARVLDRAEQGEIGLDHARSGELVALAERGCWFAYHYWLDEAERPDFARTVDIHRKPGYDPAELFLDPKIRASWLRIAWILLKKKLGFRYLMDVIPTDPSLVRGSHGLLPSKPELGPLYLASPGLNLPDSPRVDQLLFTSSS